MNNGQLAAATTKENVTATLFPFLFTSTDVARLSVFSLRSVSISGTALRFALGYGP